MGLTWFHHSRFNSPYKQMKWLDKILSWFWLVHQITYPITDICKLCTSQLQTMRLFIPNCYFFFPLTYQMPTQHYLTSRGHIGPSFFFLHHGTQHIKVHLHQLKHLQLPTACNILVSKMFRAGFTSLLSVAWMHSGWHLRKSCHGITDPLKKMRNQYKGLTAELPHLGYSAHLITS